jgi:hypothetical protein
MLPPLWEFILGNLTHAAIIVCLLFLIHRVMKAYYNVLYYFFMFAFMSGVIFISNIIFPKEKPVPSILLEPSPKIYTSQSHSIDPE